ncbi:MAG TPA: sialate O-acetylesterase [Steroidobacteraceae bacterium]|nr:sialate O-acetylesterase [Steroidobacteraceae bacterium]
MRSAILSALAISALTATVAGADVRLPALVGDNMVLQRDARIEVWGWADPGENVRVTFQDRTIATRADRSGHWTAALGPYSAGGPHAMVVAGKNTRTLRDVLVGDVWLASGQSNMEWPVKGPNGPINDADREVAEALFPGIRLFKVKYAPAAQPQNDVAADGWQAVTPETASDFSAVAYLFGRSLHQRYRVPIGLIQSAVGGTVAEAWTSEAGLKQFPEFRSAIEPLARVTDRARTDYEQYAQRKAAWYRREGAVDRGSGAGAWHDPAVDVGGWPKSSAPISRPHCGERLNGFAGVVWFRREVELPPAMAAMPLTLHLGSIAQDDATYFNGQKVGETRGLRKPREYMVHAQHVRAGKNIVVTRVVGANRPGFACVELLGPAGAMKAENAGGSVSLAGDWSYQPGPELRDFPVADAVTLAAGPSPNIPTVLYNGMIHPLLRYRIKGVIWYQGESNADAHERAAQYRTLFPALIQDWRRQWRSEFPFLFVQLAGHGANQPEPAEYPWAELREAQSMTLSLPGTGMATAVDIGDEWDIHPRNKQDVAQRLALTAAAVAYGETVLHSGPTYRSMQVEGGQIRIQFANLGSGLAIRDRYGYARGFEIAGADGRFHWAQARQDGDDIIVSSSSVRQPAAVRYSWSNTPDGNLYNREGLPALPFRTKVPHVN